MKYSLVFLASGSFVLLFGFLLRTISLSNALGRVPPYMGPPVDTSILHAMRMWIFPYVLDTGSCVTLVISIGLILLGVSIALRNKSRTKTKPKNVSRNNDSLYPYQ